MHNALIFVLCLALFAGAVFGIFKLYAWRNGGLYPWQDDVTASRPVAAPRSGSPPKTQ